MIAALASPVRVRILQLVWDAELPAGQIAADFDITFGAVSQHLAVLRDAGLITVRRDGKSRLYKADRAALGPMAQALEAMWSDKLLALKNLAEQDQRAQNKRPPAPIARKSRRSRR